MMKQVYIPNEYWDYGAMVVDLWYIFINVIQHQFFREILHMKHYLLDNRNMQNCEPSIAKDFQIYGYIEITN